MAFLGESEESILALNVPPTAGLYGGVGVHCSRSGLYRECYDSRWARQEGNYLPFKGNVSFATNRHAIQTTRTFRLQRPDLQ
jgi:hypothetical protein